MRLIPLTKGRSAKVDDADYAWLMQWKWYAQKVGPARFYAARRTHSRGPLIYMHRVINGTPDDLLTDHRDGDGLNNQRANLRDATPRQNMMNRVGKAGSSTFKGVWFEPAQKGKKRWRTAIRVYGKLKYLGRFATAPEAAAAYESAARQYFGDFARTTAGATQ